MVLLYRLASGGRFDAGDNVKVIAATSFTTRATYDYAKITIGLNHDSLDTEHPQLCANFSEHEASDRSVNLSDAGSRAV